MEGFHFQDNEAQRHKTDDNGVAEVIFKVYEFIYHVDLRVHDT